MVITTYEDLKYKLRVRHELSLYYWGEGCIVEFREQPIFYLSRIETSIISMCDGVCSVQNILDRAKAFSTKSKNEIIAVINDLLNNHILLLRKEAKKYTPHIFGEIGKFFPKDITFELTNKCNYRCPFCYKNAKSEGIFIKEEIIDGFIEVLKGRLESILLTGGEPLLHPNFKEILTKLSSMAEVRIVSNGSLFHELSMDIVSKLYSLQLSLYGTSRAEYKMVTGNENGLEDIRKSLELAKVCHVPTRLSVVLNEKTIKDIEKYVITAIELGAENLNLDTAYLFGRELNMFSGDSEYKKQVDEFYFKELECMKKYHKDIRISMRTVNTFSWKGRYKLEGYEGLNCGAGSRKIVVSQNGKIRACECFPENLFDYGGIDVLEKMIQGDFQITKLCTGMEQFYEVNGEKLKNTEICTAITDFCNRKNIMVKS